jgi:hypothetical protein
LIALYRSSQIRATEIIENLRGNVQTTPIWGTLEQSVFGEPAYPSIESKAAHLLYFVVGLAGAVKQKLTVSPSQTRLKP